ncbi:MAG: sugar phosphate nucleotidyltransferase, partial [Candidatus Omnitrophica bacterium]|nr:sugar phosphate nucleotidyltransferase [Candidatus Omnitrophota bacterium]
MKTLNLDTVILCGGLGTRLRQVLGDLPKPMALIGTQPFLEILIEHLKNFGLNRIILCTGFGGETIRRYFQKRNAAILISEELTPLGTAGALKHCENLLRSENLFVLNGDSFCPVNFPDLFDFHKKRKGIATIVSVDSNSRTDGGAITLGEGNRITGFSEKGQKKSPVLNAGIYVLNRKILQKIPEGSSCSLEYE